jgi:hypothetical protein
MIDSGDVGRRRPGRRRWLFVVLPLVALVCAVGVVPAWYLGRFLVAPTIEAGRGADCPGCAVDELLREGPFGSLGGTGMAGDDVDVLNVLCGKRKDELRAQLRELAGTYLAAAAQWGVTPELTAGVVISGDSPADMEDGHVVITVPIRHLHGRGGFSVSSDHETQWTFEVIEDDGWRVCAIGHPPVCEAMIRCEGYPESPPARLG